MSFFELSKDVMSDVRKLMKCNLSVDAQTLVFLSNYMLEDSNKEGIETALDILKKYDEKASISREMDGEDFEIDFAYNGPVDDEDYLELLELSCLGVKSRYHVSGPVAYLNRHFKRLNSDLRLIVYGSSNPDDKEGKPLIELYRGNLIGEIEYYF